MAALQKCECYDLEAPREVAYWVSVPSPEYDAARHSLLNKEQTTVRVNDKLYPAFCIEFTPEWPGNRAKVVWLITEAEPVA